jgi:mannose-1-phosphate guanylyltransferase
VRVFVLIFAGSREVMRRSIGAMISTMQSKQDNSAVRVLLTCAGVGSRLRPITDTLPKALVPIAGRPLLDYWFDCFERAGIVHVLMNTHHLPEQLRAYAQSLNATGRFAIEETHEPVLLGSAGTISANRGFVPEPGSQGDGDVLIIYSDNLSDIDLGAFLQYHRSHGDAFTMLLFRAQFPEKSGIAELDTSDAPMGPDGTRLNAGKMKSFVEKPKQPKSNLANAGLYAMSSALWHEIAGWGAFDIGFDVLPRLVGRMRGIEIAPPIGSYHRDIGTHESLAIAEADAGRVFGRRAARVGTVAREKAGGPVDGLGGGSGV